MKSNARYEFAVPAKLCAFFCTLITVFLITDKDNLWMLTVTGLLYVLVQRQWKQGIGFGIFYLALSLLLLLIRQGMRMPVLSEFHIFMFWWLTPVFIVAWSLMTTPPGKLSAFFSKLHAPRSLTLGMLVVFRFFPTMRAQWRGLREAMHNRGLTTGKQMVAHPAATFEYTLIPVLMSCLQISDQLAVSAVSRGLDTPGRRESYYESKMKAADYACMALFIAAMMALLIGGKMA